MFFVTMVLALSTAAEPAVYVHPSCGYSFRVPPGYHVKPTTNDERTNCEVQVRPVGDDRDSVAAWVDSGEGDFARGVEGSGFAEVTEWMRERTKPPQPTVGMFVAYQPGQSWKEAHRIERGELTGLEVDGLNLDCTDNGRLEHHLLRCPGDVAFLGNGHRYVNVTSMAPHAVFDTIVHSLTIPLPAMKTFVHPACRYSFRHLASWVVTATPDSCEVHVRPSDFETLMKADDVDRYTITVDSDDGGFDTAADEAGFVRVTDDLGNMNRGLHAGDWIALGRGSVHSPQPFSRDGLHGLRVDDLDDGCYHEHGGYSGLCAWGLAFLTDGSRYVRIDGHPSLAYGDVIATMRLTP